MPPIRGIAEADWPQVAVLEAEAYADTSLTEGATVLRSRVRASADTCFVLHLNGRIAGYILALPYPKFHFPDLTRPEQTIYHSPNLHLHDLVISEAVRHKGFGTRLVNHLTDTARERGFESMSLIAVGGKETFWRAHGYQSHRGTRIPRSYGSDAVYMSTQVTACQSHEGRKVGRCA
ncbi:GNAT family N-acetyltransferase [Streptomyces sp. R08]|uniref:GNAT family N-acetyltransferase n=1 Tax=Streptomyces sp. R08 TaxID=3238624 RepID=A0AB39MP99_9ACTN